MSLIDETRELLRRIKYRPFAHYTWLQNDIHHPNGELIGCYSLRYAGDEINFKAFLYDDVLQLKNNYDKSCALGWCGALETEEWDNDNYYRIAYVVAKPGETIPDNPFSEHESELIIFEEEQYIEMIEFIASKAHDP